MMNPMPIDRKVYPWTTGVLEMRNERLQKNTVLPNFTLEEGQRMVAMQRTDFGHFQIKAKFHPFGWSNYILL